MQKLILTYGAITGLIVITTMSIGIYAAEAGGNAWSGSVIVGFAIMIIGFSTIFVATKKHRDEELGGVIKFGTALKVGLGISVVAGVAYSIGWEIALFLTDYVYVEPFKDTYYANLFFRMPITFTEIFPIGLLISLISSALFKNPNFLKSSANLEMQ